MGRLHRDNGSGRGAGTGGVSPNWGGGVLFYISIHDFGPKNCVQTRRFCGVRDGFPTIFRLDLGSISGHFRAPRKSRLGKRFGDLSGFGERVVSAARTQDTWFDVHCARMHRQWNFAVQCLF